MNRDSFERAGRSVARTILPVVLAGALVATCSTAAISAESHVPASTTITLTSTDSHQAGDANARRLLSSLDQRNDEPGGVFRRLVALPDCDSAIVAEVEIAGSELDAEAVARIAWVEDIVRIRDQSVAVVALDPFAIAREQSRLGGTDLRVVVWPEGGRGPVSRNAGPFTSVCERAILNYEPSGSEARSWLPPSGSARDRGTVTYCHSVEDCASAGTDLLMLVADELHYSPFLQVLANHHATYLGLNISVVGMSDLDSLTAEALHQFVQDVYESQSAAHFGDGHLGFVVLVGDAYADDNTTVMVPTYDGYGGTEVASDHYYACVSGDDDYEDVMIGRLSVGNVSELVAVIDKIANYMPQEQGEPWTESTLLVAGLFYTLKDEYVSLFDEYEGLMPDGWNVDRIYRHDYPNNHTCSVDVVDGFNDGHLFVNFAGDGWISEWYQVLDTTDIPNMDNGDMLPIVLSMACNTGWYDNTTEIDQTGSYDCFAEQIVNTPNRGAIACLAAPRASDGGIFRTLSETIYQAAFTEHCTFLGETISVAKLLHVQSGGTVDYARHFNLFGDPSLIYRWDAEPGDGPELIVRPHEIAISPELPAEGDDLSLQITVRNHGTVPADGVLLRISDVSSGGSYSHDVSIPHIGDWSAETVTTVISALPGAGHLVTVQVDPDNDFDEIDETNNTTTFDVFVYPHVPGFPSTTGDASHGTCLARLGGAGTHVLVIEGEAQVRAIDQNGETAWLTDPATAPADYGPEVAPAVGDLDGDVTNEVVATRRMALAAFDASGEQLWSSVTDDPVGSPVLADADADGDLDVIVATKMFFGGSSKIAAYDEDGAMLWTYSLPSGDPASATPAVGDLDMDGFPDFVFGTSDGFIGAASCSEIPPVELWAPIELGAAPVTTLALADIDGDGILEIAAGGDAVYVRNAEDGSECWTATLDTTVAAIAVGDIDSAGASEVVAASDGGSVYMLSGGAEVWNVQLAARPAASIAIADVVDDHWPELIIQTEDELLHVLAASGDEAVVPIPVPGAGCASPFTADLTGDGRPEVCISSCVGNVFAFGFEGTAPEPIIEWHGQGGNAARSGLMVQPFSGTISSGATFRGRYDITGDVLIDSGATVTVLPDAVLDFADNTELEVAGSLHVAGQDGAEVSMNAADGARAAWRGLDIKAGSTVTITECEVSGATVGIRGYQASVTLNGCRVEGGATGARLTDCTLAASTSSFSLADSLGMYLNGGGGTITDCTFDENGHAGLWCDDHAEHDIVRSSFTNTTEGDGLRLYRYSNVFVDTCSIIGNSDNGVVVQSASPEISNCVITDNGQVGIKCRRTSNPMVCWSVISENALGVSAESGALPNLGDTIFDNTGFNSIFDNTTAAVANYNNEGGSPLQIRENWWGSYPPTGRIFIGFVKYYPCLEAPPVHDPGGGGSRYAEGEEAVTPSEFRLGHCSPNPFNPVTTVAFDVPESVGPIDVSVFDVAGRRVATLYSGHHDPGTHSVTWNGRDEAGRNVASGIYFVHMSAADFRASRKMVLLK